MTMQGDAYIQPIEIKMGENVLAPKQIVEIEVCFGEKVRKTLSDEQMTFDDNKKLWLIPLSQEDTFSIGHNVRVNVRVKLSDGTVKGFDAGIIKFDWSISKVIL